MLIINADDWGGSSAATDNSLVCYENGRITSASAMVFSVDSERAADIALSVGLPTGLHLNFTDQLVERTTPVAVLERQRQIASFLSRSKYRSLLYNPFLGSAFDYVYKAQYEEYVRLYHREPTHIDGHHHMHLSTNMLIGRVIPRGSRVRRTFTFTTAQRNPFNLMYRRFVNTVVERRYVCTDRFYSILPIEKQERLADIFEHARSQSVELMVHPERQAEFYFLMSAEFLGMLSRVELRSYAALRGNHCGDGTRQ